MGRDLTPRDAARSLRLLTVLATDEAVGVLNRTAEKVTEIATSKAPVRTGRLRQSIATRKANTKQKRLGAASGVKRGRGGVTGGELFEGDKQNAYYWKFVEYGTVNNGSKPMFRPAAQMVESDHRRDIVRSLKRAASNMAKRA